MANKEALAICKKYSVTKDKWSLLPLWNKTIMTPNFMAIQNNASEWYNSEYFNENLTKINHRNLGELKIFTLYGVWKKYTGALPGTWVNLFDIKGYDTTPHHSLVSGNGFLIAYTRTCSTTIPIEMQSNGQVLVERTWGWGQGVEIWFYCFYCTTT